MSLITVHRMSVIHVAGVALLSDSMPWLSADLSSVSALFPRHSTLITVSGIVASSFRFLDLHTHSLSFGLHFSLFLNSHQSSPEYISYVHHMCVWECVVFIVLYFLSFYTSAYFKLSLKKHLPSVRVTVSVHVKIKHFEYSHSNSIFFLRFSCIF